jgi:hypothetical protein
MNVTDALLAVYLYEITSSPHQITFTRASQLYKKNIPYFFEQYTCVWKNSCSCGSKGLLLLKENCRCPNYMLKESLFYNSSTTVNQRLFHTAMSTMIWTLGEPRSGPSIWSNLIKMHLARILELLFFASCTTGSAGRSGGARKETKKLF